MPNDKKLTYKEKNGTTRVGDALRWLVNSGKDIAPEILDIAGKVTGIDGLNLLADKIEGTDSLDDFDKEMLRKQIELDKTEMQEVTKRWEADMESDSWLSKNVRPLLTITTILVIFVIVFVDSSSSNFNVKSHWVDLLSFYGGSMILALFGSRGYEKIKKVAGKRRL